MGKTRGQELADKMNGDVALSDAEREEAAVLAVEMSCTLIREALMRMRVPQNSVTWTAMVTLGVAALMDCKPEERKSNAGYLRDLANDLEKGTPQPGPGKRMLGGVLVRRVGRA